MESDEGAVVTVVSSGAEADIVCGLLRTAGIECWYRDTDAIESPLEDFTAAGPREILVNGADLEAARELLSAPPDEADDGAG
jgi:putative signal transducing protein